MHYIDTISHCLPKNEWAKHELNGWLDNFKEGFTSCFYSEIASRGIELDPTKDLECPTPWSMPWLLTIVDTLEGECISEMVKGYVDEIEDDLRDAIEGGYQYEEE